MGGRAAKSLCSLLALGSAGNRSGLTCGENKAEDEMRKECMEEGNQLTLARMSSSSNAKKSAMLRFLDAAHV